MINEIQLDRKFWNIVQCPFKKIEILMIIALLILKFFIDFATFETGVLVI